ncbi:MAG: hypothetical protein ACLFWF_07075 [Alphaproteobacteria bacterium]
MSGKRIERLQIMLNEEELAAIDEWRFRHRMPSRSAAVRAMLNVAIESKSPPSAEEPASGVAKPSGEVGVLDPSSVSEKTACHRGRRIVVIEPGRVAAAGITTLLERAGHEVVAVLTGVENWKETSFRNLPECAVIGDGLNPQAAARLADELNRHGVPYVYFKTRPEVPVPGRFRDTAAVDSGADADEFNESLERVFPF